MRLWCPRGSEELLRQAVDLGVERVSVPVEINGLDAGERVSREQYDVIPFRTTHGGWKSLGYAISEHARLGRFDPARARELGIPEGPLWGKLHHGESIEMDGRTIHASELVGAPRPGRLVVYSGDTRPSPRTIDAAAGADLLIHEATFGEDEADRAVATGHSTAREAARVARDAGVRRLALTHFSPRYADDPRAIEREAKTVFADTVSAFDGMVIEIPYRDE